MSKKRLTPDFRKSIEDRILAMAGGFHSAWVDACEHSNALAGELDKLFSRSSPAYRKINKKLCHHGGVKDKWGNNIMPYGDAALMIQEVIQGEHFFHSRKEARAMVLEEIRLIAGWRRKISDKPIHPRETKQQAMRRVHQELAALLEQYGKTCGLQGSDSMKGHMSVLNDALQRIEKCTDEAQRLSLILGQREEGHRGR